MPFINSSKGYTLLETVIAIIIFGVLVSVTISVVANQSESYSQLVGQTMGLADARKAIRSLRNDVQNMAVSNISTMQAEQLVFADFGGNTITYNFLSGTLLRNGVTLVNGLVAAPFAYLDINQDTTAIADSVKFIGIDLNISNNGQALNMEELIYARN